MHTKSSWSFFRHCVIRMARARAFLWDKLKWWTNSFRSLPFLLFPGVTTGAAVAKKQRLALSLCCACSLRPTWRWANAKVLSCEGRCSNLQCFNVAEEMELETETWTYNSWKYAHYFKLIGSKDEKNKNAKCEVCPGGTRNTISNLLKHLQQQQGTHNLFKRSVWTSCSFHLPDYLNRFKGCKKFIFFKNASLKGELQSTVIILTFTQRCMCNVCILRRNDTITDFWGVMEK